MDQEASPDNRSAWERLVEHADTARLHDISAMDIYNVKLPNGMPYFQRQTTCLMLFSGSPAGDPGQAHGGRAFFGQWHRHYKLAHNGTQNSRATVRALSIRCG